MARVICDTGIWYQNQERRKGILTATFVNFYELGYSESLHTKFERWKLATQSLSYIPCDTIWSTPQAYLLFGGDEHYENDGYQSLRPMLDFWEKFHNKLDFIGFKKEVKEWAKERKKGFYDYHDQMQNIIVTHRKSEKILSSKEEIIRIFRTSFCDNFLSSEFDEFDRTKIDWGEFELFENTVIQFFHELSTTNMGWQVNDYPDLSNLVYVSPRDHYYVIEKKWIGLIERAGMGHYLFPTKS